MRPHKLLSTPQRLVPVSFSIISNDYNWGTLQFLIEIECYHFLELRLELASLRFRGEKMCEQGL